MSLILLATGPALAHHKAEHDKGTATQQEDKGCQKYTDQRDKEGPCVSQRTRSEQQWPGIRGKSPSVPDDDGKGMDRGSPGPDKQHDGNNGCGNEPRTEGHPGEDDNNGHCGKPVDKGGPGTVGPTPPVGSPSPTQEPSPSMEPTVMGKPPIIVPSASPTESVKASENIPPSPVPFTGSNVGMFVLIGLALVTAGTVLWLRR